MIDKVGDIGVRTDMEGRRVVIDFGEPITKDGFDHLLVFVQAFGIYLERNKERGTKIWRRVGVMGNCVFVLSKAERAFNEAVHGRTPNPDHLLDIINYAAFVLQQKDDIRGEWPWKENSRDEEREAQADHLRGDGGDAQGTA